MLLEWVRKKKERSRPSEGADEAEKPRIMAWSPDSLAGRLGKR